MKIVLLCAGYATRLYPLTENQPKPLLPVGGRPILEWILERVSKIEGVESVHLVSNEKFAGHFESWAQHVQYPWPVDVVNDCTSSNETRLGAIGDLSFVIRTRNLKPDDLMVVAGDNFFDFDLSSFVEYGNKVRPHGVIAVYDVKDKELARRYGLVRMREDGKIFEFQEKPEDPKTTLASSGIYWLPKEIWGLLDTYVKGGHNTDQPGHYMRWLAEKSGLYAFPLKGKWLDIGDLASYQKANAIVN